MARTHSEDVFSLVRSLSQTEKRYFKLYASMGGSGSSTAYVKLFDCLDGMKRYDEKKILRKVTSIKPSQLSNQKKYLSELILESLNICHAHKSVESTLNFLIQSFDILYEKRLYSQCRKMLAKAKAIAEENQKFSHLLDILEKQELLLIETLYNEESEAEMEKIFEKDFQVIGQIRNSAEYKKLFIEAMKIFQKEGLVRDKKAITKLDKLMKDPLLKNEKKLLSFHDRYHYYNIYGLNYMFRSDWKNCHVFRRKVIELIHAHPGQIRAHTRLYVSALNNYIISSQYVRSFDELFFAFGKVKEIFHDKLYAHRDAVQLRLLGCFSSMLHFYIHAGLFEEGVRLFSEIEEKFLRLRKNIPKTSEMSFYYTFCYIHFGAGQYNKALHWLNQILNDPESHSREDIRAFSRIFNLIIHYELGNRDLLDYIVKSTYRFLLRRKKLYKTESLIIDFIRKSSRADSRKEMMEVFGTMRNEFIGIAKDPFERRALEYFDFIAWFESKIGNIPFAEAVKRRSGVEIKS